MPTKPSAECGYTHPAMAPSAQRKRFDATLERITRHGDRDGNDAEIEDLKDFCEYLFDEMLTRAGRKRALDKMSSQLTDAKVR